MWKEFKEFINNGNVFETAVGLIMALAFKPIVDSVVDIITNIISGILKLPDFSSLVITLHKASEADIAAGKTDAVIKYGALINNVISFIVIAFVLFMMVKAYNKMSRKQAVEEAPAGPSEVELLTEIRDALKARG